jgi:hypothetical protein
MRLYFGFMKDFFGDPEVNKLIEAKERLNIIAQLVNILNF